MKIIKEAKRIVDAINKKRATDKEAKKDKKSKLILKKLYILFYF